MPKLFIFSPPLILLLCAVRWECAGKHVKRAKEYLAASASKLVDASIQQGKRTCWMVVADHGRKQQLEVGC